MRRGLILFAALALGAAPSCNKSDGRDSEPAADRETSAHHAPAGVEPGSHADWCGEHGVPESQCSRCNPELTAAFKATGDWCDEHGLPESQCLACNPDLKIERPRAPEEATP